MGNKELTDPFYGYCPVCGGKLWINPKEFRGCPSCGAAFEMVVVKRNPEEE